MREVCVVVGDAGGLWVRPKSLLSAVDAVVEGAQLVDLGRDFEALTT